MASPLASGETELKNTTTAKEVTTTKKNTTPVTKANTQEKNDTKVLPELTVTKKVVLNLTHKRSNNDDL
ncbi:MAG: hypothetical protein WCL60_13495 [Methylococcales bacterium]